MTPKQIRDAYLRGENITELLRQLEGSEQNNEEIIEIAYDLQSGSYTKAMADPSMRQHKSDYAQEIASQIKALTETTSVLEPGIGEGTTLSFVKHHLGQSVKHCHGFDISWSRIACCRDWLSNEKAGDNFLSVASIVNTPYQDDSFDVVYTSHTIEPNGGNEIPILSELFRITSRYLVLLEPAYELADQNARDRMDRLGYCKGLAEKASGLGMSVIKHELFPHVANPLNPTAIIVIEKSQSANSATPQLVCPRYKTALDQIGDGFYSADSMRAYPVIQGIPCLRSEDGVIASRLGSH